MQSGNQEVGEIISGFVRAHLRQGEQVIMELPFDLDAFVNAAPEPRYRPQWNKETWAAYRSGQPALGVPEDHVPLLAIVITNQRMLRIEMGGSIEQEAELAGIYDVLDFRPKDEWIYVLHHGDPDSFSFCFVPRLDDVLAYLKSHIAKEKS